MTPEVKYERIGKFIYSASRHGGGILEVYNWMADTLGLPRPVDEAAQAGILNDYLMKYASDEQFNASLRLFIETMSSQRS
jgi:hypothetical protein